MVRQSWCLLKLSWQSFQKQTTSQSQPGSEESLWTKFSHDTCENRVLCAEWAWLTQRGEYCESEWMKRRFITEIMIDTVPQVSGVRSSSHVKDQVTEKSSLFLFLFRWLPSFQWSETEEFGVHLVLWAFFKDVIGKIQKQTDKPS